MDEEICNRCGRCCHYEYDGKMYKCKYLILTKTRSLCRVYGSRLGKVIGKHGDKKVYCIPRTSDVRVFENCPYNKYVLKNEELLDPKRKD